MLPGVTVASAHPYAPSPYVVRRRAVETSDTVTLVLGASPGATAPAFRPGQFNMLYAFGVGEAAISISGDPEATGELTHTVRSAGNVTAALAALAPGSPLGVRGPYGSAWPLEAARGKDVVVIAGGLGLPPLRGVLLDLVRHRERFGRIEVIYGARTPKDLVYYAEIQSWRQRPDLRVQVTVDAAGRDWYGDVGLVTQRIPDCRFDAKNTIALLCGPEVMMRFSAQALEGRGIAEDAIYLSLERNMKCAFAQCGHCQMGPYFLCREGPIFPYRDVRGLLATREV
ncbi:MAG: FAD/NAD(P)-binding protein [Thermoplasmata archaeon]